MTTAERVGLRIQFDNSYARLPSRFAVRLSPTPVTAPRLVRLNKPLARKLGIDPSELATQQGVEILAGNRLAEGSEPLAMAYAGHQFGGFVPQLGDGRAILLGEVIDCDGTRRDIQLKGSGPTPFSRQGDGRAALGPVLREYIVSEAMAALGIPTTRSLTAVTTGEAVSRETPLPGAVLTRVATSHVRVGTFQYFAEGKEQQYAALRVGNLEGSQHGVRARGQQLAPHRLCRLERFEVGGVEVRHINPDLVRAELAADAEVEVIAHDAFSVSSPRGSIRTAWLRAPTT